VNLCFSNAYGLVPAAKGRECRVHHITGLEPDHFQIAGAYGCHRWCSVAVKRRHLRLGEGDLHSHWFLSVSALCLRT